MISAGSEVWPWPSSLSPLDGYRKNELTHKWKMVSFQVKIFYFKENFSDSGRVTVSGVSDPKPNDKLMTQTTISRVPLKELLAQELQVSFLKKLLDI